MHAGSSSRRGRRYERIEEGAGKRGTPTKRAEDIAARTVNKERARSGVSGTTSRSSLRNPEPASGRGGRHSRSGAQGPAKGQPYEQARKPGPGGRSSTDKEQLRKAPGR
ncbi:plasmid stabilization protein [Streptomyces sp. NPDC014623]|uniref:plasmid stabilization protein n=1 Tax=Streptomyces sp. NPDC014623 TaxID=3364875 RepID=UPI0036F4E395